jgi:UDP-2,4-diacetamido-2,4,6-trideoxy-beta-L-altropyranose hydrolase
MFSIRRAQLADMELYFRWANDPASRANSWNSDIITWETHQSWFAKQLSDGENAQYIAELDGTPIGQVRFTGSGDEALIGFSVDPEFRGRGLGSKMLWAAMACYLEEYPATRRFTAKVKKGNAPSNKVFASLEFGGEDDPVTGGSIYRLDASKLRKDGPQKDQT